MCAVYSCVAAQSLLSLSLLESCMTLRQAWSTSGWLQLMTNQPSCYYCSAAQANTLRGFFGRAAGSRLHFNKPADFLNRDVFVVPSVSPPQRPCSRSGGWHGAGAALEMRRQAESMVRVGFAPTAYFTAAQSNGQSVLNWTLMARVSA